MEKYFDLRWVCGGSQTLPMRRERSVTNRYGIMSDSTYWVHPIDDDQERRFDASD